MDQEAKGVIHDLKCQVRFPLHVQGIKVATYIADACYVVTRTNQYTVEDTKSPATITALYRRNKRHMLIEYKIDVREVYVADTPIG